MSPEDTQVAGRHRKRRPTSPVTRETPLTRQNGRQRSVDRQLVLARMWGHGTQPGAAPVEDRLEGPR